MEPFGSPLELLTFPLEGSSEEEYSQWNQNHSFLFGALVITSSHSRQPSTSPLTATALWLAAACRDGVRRAALRAM